MTIQEDLAQLQDYALRMGVTPPFNHRLEQAILIYRTAQARYITAPSPESFRIAMSAFDRICGLTGMDEPAVIEMLK